MDKELWIKLIKIFIIVIIVAICLLFVFSQVIKEEEYNYKELEEARQKQTPILKDRSEQ